MAKANSAMVSTDDLPLVRYLLYGFDGPVINGSQVTADDWLLILRAEMDRIKPILTRLGTPKTIRRLQVELEQAPATVSYPRLGGQGMHFDLRVISRPIPSDLVADDSYSRREIYVSDHGELIAHRQSFPVPGQRHIDLYVLSNDELRRVIQKTIDEDPLHDCRLVVNFLGLLKEMLYSLNEARRMRINETERAIDGFASCLERLRLP